MKAANAVRDVFVRDVDADLEDVARGIFGKDFDNASLCDLDNFLPLNKVFADYAGGYYSPFKVKELLEEVDRIIEINNLQFVEHNVERAEQIADRIIDLSEFEEAVNAEE